MSLIYGALAGYFFFHSAALYFRTLQEHKLVFIAAISLATILAIRPVYFMFKPKTLYYQEHQAIMQQIKMLSNQHPVKVYTPGYLLIAAPYYYNYQVPASITFSNYSDTSTTGGSTAKKYLILNKKLNSIPSFTDALSTDSVLTTYKTSKLIFEKEPLQLFIIE
ncbi:hypothetical protein [Pontibacter rugosus]